MLSELYAIIQYFVITYNGIESEKYCIYICTVYICINTYIYTHTLYILSCILETHIINQLYFNLRKEKRVDRI